MLDSILPIYTIENSDTNFMDYLTKTKTSVFKFQAVSVAKVNKFLRSLTACKSTGTDKIPAKIIRIAAPVIADPLTKIFNTANFGPISKLYYHKMADDLRGEKKCKGVKKGWSKRKLLLMTTKKCLFSGENSGGE